MKGHYTLIRYITVVAIFANFALATHAQGLQHYFPIRNGDGRTLTIRNVNTINTEALEFSPSYYQNGIVYVSSHLKKSSVDEKIKENFFTLFYSEIAPDGLPMQPVPYSPNVTSQVHEGPVTFSSDWNTMYFTRNNPAVSRLKILSATRGESDWQDATELSFCDSRYSYQHPTLSADGQKLYFASNMPNGMGGMDLYVSERIGNEWSEPINLGAPINTYKNEAFPYIHPSGVLYFASEGQPGYGGYDMYSVNMNSGELREIVNLREPLNSGADDLGFIMNADGTGGFFTSNREGGAGKDDIYLFQIQNSASNANTLATTVVVYDKNTNKRIPAANIRIFERSGDSFIGADGLYDVVMEPAAPNAKELILKLVRKSEASLGKPNALTNQNGEATTTLNSGKQYLILASKESYLSSEMMYSTIGKSGNIQVEVPLETAHCTPIVGVIRDQATGSLLPNVLVRFTNTCTGKEQLLHTNNNGEFEYCIEQNCDFNFSLEKQGYSTIRENIAKSNSPATIRREFALAPTDNNNTNLNNGQGIMEGTVFVIEKIYYDFNMSVIRRGAAKELDALVTLMQQHQGMTIRLIAHTDSRGRAEYNLELSQKRAEEAKRYLESRGIASERITTEGRGESEPRNGCVDGVTCSEEEHQYNRRTEVLVTKIDNNLEIKYEDRGPEIIDYKKQ